MYKSDIRTVARGIESFSRYLTLSMQSSEAPSSDELASIQKEIADAREGVAKATKEGEEIFGSLDAADQLALGSLRNELLAKVREFEELLNRSGL